MKLLIVIGALVVIASAKPHIYFYSNDNNAPDMNHLKALYNSNAANSHSSEIQANQQNSASAAQKSVFEQYAEADVAEAKYHRSNLRTQISNRQESAADSASQQNENSGAGVPVSKPELITASNFGQIGSGIASVAQQVSSEVTSAAQQIGSTVAGENHGSGVSVSGQQGGFTTGFQVNPGFGGGNFGAEISVTNPQLTVTAPGAETAAGEQSSASQNGNHGAGVTVTGPQWTVSGTGALPGAAGILANGQQFGAGLISAGQQIASGINQNIGNLGSGFTLNPQLPFAPGQFASQVLGNAVLPQMIANGVAINAQHAGAGIAANAQNIGSGIASQAQYITSGLGSQGQHFGTGVATNAQQLGSQVAANAQLLGNGIALGAQQYLPGFVLFFPQLAANAVSAGSQNFQNGILIPIQQFGNLAAASGQQVTSSFANITGSLQNGLQNFLQPTPVDSSTEASVAKKRSINKRIVSLSSLSQDEIEKLADSIPDFTPDAIRQSLEYIMNHPTTPSPL